MFQLILYLKSKVSGAFSGMSSSFTTYSLPTVCDKIPWNSTRLSRSEDFVAYSPLAMLFECEFLNLLAKTTLRGGKEL